MNKNITDGIACRVLLIHPSKGFEERGRFMDVQLKGMGIDYECVSGADADSELLVEMSKQLFSGELANASAAHRSCTAKHLLAYRRVLQEGWPGVLVFEDDMELSPRFADIVSRSLAEVPEGATIVSYEDTRMRFVERSRRQRGRLLYPGDRDRMAGAYYINRAACQLFMDIADRQKIGLPIDIEHRCALKRKDLQYLWCEPTVASQGSFSGRFTSALDGKRHRFEALRYRLRRAYRRLLYFLR